MNSTRSKPAHELRFGSVKAAIWRNETENGYRFNTTFTRSYKDGEQWHSTDSFGRDDLLVVAKLADLAHSWIHAQPRENGSDPNGAAGSGPNSQAPSTNPSPTRSNANTYSRNRPNRDSA